MSPRAKNGAAARAKRPRILVIGGGAAGCMAALSAAETEDVEVVLAEAGDSVGRKLRVTGNGRGNVTNASLTEDAYYSSDPGLVRETLRRFGTDDLAAFFRDNGIPLHERGGYYYPRTDQASTLVRFFMRELSRRGVSVRTRMRIVSLQKRGGKFAAVSDGGQEVTADAVILAAGGLAGGEKLGCLGDGYAIARSLGHSVAQPRPALAPLLCAAPYLKLADGARCRARVFLVSDDEKEACPSPHAAAEGELQLTAGALSGICIFQISHAAGEMITRCGRVSVHTDFLPELTDEEWDSQVRMRLADCANMTLGDLMLGLVHERVIRMVLDRHGLQPEMKRARVGQTGLLAIFRDLRDLPFPVTAVAGFDRAQVTAGGVPASEVDEDFASRCCRGLYLCGEVLDTDGLCGGYNLHWAFAGGHIAGRAAAAAAGKGRKQQYPAAEVQA